VEGLEQAGEIVGRNPGPGVFHSEASSSVVEAGGDLNPAAFGAVVADGIVNEVVGQAFQQDRVACDGV
jgi:hypothetical protein